MEKIQAKRVLIGTQNPSKVNFFKRLLEGFVIEMVTPDQVGITEAPPENGKTPIENAVEKAVFYGEHQDVTIGTDSGLFFADLPEHDPRQPGLHVRSPYGIRLSDEEMIAYYTGLVRGIGGETRAYYKDSFALKVRDQVFRFEPKREDLIKSSFVLRGTPVDERVPGWPLDSLSWDQNGESFADPKRRRGAQDQWAYLPDLREFLRSAFAQGAQACSVVFVTCT